MIDDADGRTLYEFSREFVPARGIKAVNDVALALVGQPPDKVDEGIAHMLQLFAKKLAAQPNPPSQVFVDGVVVVCREMLRERIAELESGGSGQA
jgi:hypothetical protein